MTHRAEAKGSVCTSARMTVGRFGSVRFGRSMYVCMYNLSPWMEFAVRVRVSFLLRTGLSQSNRVGRVIITGFLYHV